MADNTGKFVREWGKEVSELVDDINAEIRNTAMYGWNLVTTGTPVQTGRARGSWLLTVDEVKDNTLSKAKGKDRKYSDPPLPAFSYDFMKNRSLFMTNNVDYIEYLEYGTDKFAPFAMVTKAAPKINRELGRRISKLKSKEY